MYKQSKIMIELFRTKCEQHKLRVTPQRLVIYEELVKSKDHPSADVIFKRTRKLFPNISFDTVYRTLLTFTEIGLVRLVEGYGEAKRFDPDLDSHHHLRCIKCNTIIDFHEKAYDKLPVPPNIEQQFEIINKRVVLEGICKNCIVKRK